MTRFFDVFNGDADGLIARHQYRLSFPVPCTDLTLITGSKREVSLVSRVDLSGIFADAVDISVFDISYDQNEASVQRLLDAGAAIRYFDHHRATRLLSHPQLVAHIDTSPQVCTSLIVDRYLSGAHRLWAITAAFGDNLTETASQLAAEAGLPIKRTLLLQSLGECINYNAYGDSISDLYYPPQEIANRMAPYQSPFEFAQREEIFLRLQAGFAADLQMAHAVTPHDEGNVASVYVLPDESWARRVSGAFANRLVRASPQRAHAVLSCTADGMYTVSIRAPLENPQDADAIAVQFTGGGGRAAAAGINRLAAQEITRLIALLEQTYSTPAD